MAQPTAGIKFYYGESTVTDSVPAVPAAWTEIPDVTSTPAMGAAPAQLDTTTLAQTVMKTSIPGLMDLGSLEFGANMTPELVAAVALAAADPGTGKARAFKVSFPAPLSLGYWWTGEIQTVRPGEASVDAVASTTLYVSIATALAEIDESAVS